jgi:hypothetical protein
MKEKKDDREETNLHRIKAKNPPILGKFTKEALMIYACYLIDKSDK